MSIVRNVAGIAKGMSITLREMFAPTEVENYPDGPGPNRGAVFEQRFRGAHVLERDENGMEKCVACFLCAAACPAREYAPAPRTHPGRADASGPPTVACGRKLRQSDWKKDSSRLSLSPKAKFQGFAGFKGFKVSQV